MDKQGFCCKLEVEIDWTAQGGSSELIGWVVEPA
jgi:hypothetical protein